MPPARLQWAAGGLAAVWRRSAAVARRLPQTAAHNDERTSRAVERVKET